MCMWGDQMIPIVDECLAHAAIRATVLDSLREFF